VVILGGGTGGTLIANGLRRQLADEDEITVVDRDDDHLYQPGLLFVPFGRARPEAIVRSRGRQLAAGVGYRLGAADSVDIGARRIQLGCPCMARARRCPGSGRSSGRRALSSRQRVFPARRQYMLTRGWLPARCG
jgi:NADPH-dependent 2,4-dienoyl-CoA reductase/sulfur reductase-like enzyme